jgi:hypothetical protein
LTLSIKLPSGPPEGQVWEFSKSYELADVSAMGKSAYFSKAAISIYVLVRFLAGPWAEFA